MPRFFPPFISIAEWGPKEFEGGGGVVRGQFGDQKTRIYVRFVKYVSRPLCVLAFAGKTLWGSGDLRRKLVNLKGHRLGLGQEEFGGVVISYRLQSIKNSFIPPFSFGIDYLKLDLS